MKKFAVIKKVGTWENRNGAFVVNGKVERSELVTDSNDYMELHKEFFDKPTEYAANGEWYSYFIEPRAKAKRYLAN